MKKYVFIILILLIAFSGYIWFEFGRNGKIGNNSNNDKVGLANPASTNCVDKGGNLEIKKDENGGEFGICNLAGGAMCEEWSYYRGECSAADSLAYMKNSQIVAENWIKLNATKYLNDGHSLNYIKTESLSCLYCFEYSYDFKTGVGAGKKDHSAKVRVEKGKIATVIIDGQAQEINNGNIASNNLDYIFISAQSAQLKMTFDNTDGGTVKFASKNNKDYYRVEAALPLIGDGLYKAWLTIASSTQTFISIGQLKYSPEMKKYKLDVAIDKSKVLYNRLVITKQKDIKDVLPGENISEAVLLVDSRYQVEMK